MASEADIRPAEDRDAPAIRGCVRAAYEKYVGRIGREPAPMLTDYDAAIEGGEAWVLDEAGELAGVLVARPGKNHLFVETVAVRPDRQGGGLGGRLMAFAEDEARRLGLREIRLYTNEKMRENFSFYGGLGFEETGRRTEDGYRRVFMRKRLEQEPEARTKGGNER